MIVANKPIEQLTDKDKAFLLVAHAMMTAAERGYVRPAPLQCKPEMREYARSLLADGFRVDPRNIEVILEYCLGGENPQRGNQPTLVRIAELMLEQEAERPDWQEEACNDSDKSWR